MTKDLRISIKNELIKLFNHRPSFSNYYKKCVVYKFYGIDDDTYERAKRDYKDVARMSFKRSTWNSVLVCFLKPGVDVDFIDFWLTRPTHLDSNMIASHHERMKAMINERVDRLGEES